MTEKEYRLNKWGTKLLKNNRPLFDWTNESDEIVDLLNSLNDENEMLKQINRNLGDFRNFITEQNVSNEKQRKELHLQMLRLYNYFEDWFEDTMSPNAFSEMWDNVKEDRNWEKK